MKAAAFNAERDRRARIVTLGPHQFVSVEQRGGVRRFKRAAVLRETAEQTEARQRAFTIDQVVIEQHLEPGKPVYFKEVSSIRLGK